ncbi:hypothetical protein [Caldimonas tepidiphila]|uniref:hypothetical protein n=1 Tax=Caldimonas tepidiphila TaxID=2315841 RepID=UPI000E5BFE64|nr:hypothetical protein [Caldimonas tepidiphila]
MRKNLRLLILPAALLAFPLAALSDPGKDESGHGKHRHGRGEYKEEYWDGPCKVERKFEKNGGYKEERKCKGVPHGHYAPAPAVYVPAQLPAVTEPGIVIQGTVRIK